MKKSFSLFKDRVIAMSRNLISIVFVLSVFLIGCSPIVKEVKMKPISNPAVYFEIPVSDMDRAMSFYQKVFGFDFTKEIIHGNEMALMPFDQDILGITGALAKGNIYKPSKRGIVIYLHTDDIQNTIKRSNNLGGKILFPRTEVGEYGYVAEIEDSEGNRIGLSEKK
jgi:predicted enzyme related to lactoylglutathione lyase